MLSMQTKIQMERRRYEVQNYAEGATLSDQKWLSSEQLEEDDTNSDDEAEEEQQTYAQKIVWNDVRNLRLADDALSQVPAMDVSTAKTPMDK